MGLTMKLTKCGAMTQPMAAPITMEASELMMRLRSHEVLEKRHLSAGLFGG